MTLYQQFRLDDQTLIWAESLAQAQQPEEALAVFERVVTLAPGQAKPLMQMPAGTGTFQTVPEQLEILRLEQ